jgi:cytochrome c551/c552
LSKSDVRITFSENFSMRKSISLVVLALFIASCGESPKKESKGFEVTRKKQVAKTEASSSEIPVDLSNKGIGPITSYAFSADVNMDLVEKGKRIYAGKCTACHLVDRRMIGPALKGIYDRRSPEWVLNILLNTNEMLQKDPVAKALLKEYNNALMINQNLTEDDAKAVAEYLRTL